MRLFLIIILFLLAFRLALAGPSGISINGGAVSIKGGYAAFGPQIPEETVIVSTSTAGQCMGILCAVTKAN